MVTKTHFSATICHVTDRKFLVANYWAIETLFLVANSLATETFFWSPVIAIFKHRPLKF